MEDLSTVRSALEETTVNTKMPMKKMPSDKKVRKERSRGENEIHTAIREKQLKTVTLRSPSALLNFFYRSSIY